MIYRYIIYIDIYIDVCVCVILMHHISLSTIQISNPLSLVWELPLPRTFSLSSLSLSIAEYPWTCLLSTPTLVRSLSLYKTIPKFPGLILRFPTIITQPSILLELVLS